MDTLSYKTISANKENAGKKWIVLDANEAILGRLASKAAFVLRGKHKTNFTPHADCGDYVIILNADKIELTGQKWDQKTYIRHTGYPGGQRSLLAKELMAKKPIDMVEKAIRGMLPKNRLGRDLFRNLYVYQGTEHPHGAQKPVAVKLDELK